MFELMNLITNKEFCHDIKADMKRASFKDFGHFQRCKFIEIFFFQVGKLVQQLIPTMEIDSKRNSQKWKLILRVISTIGNWIQTLLLEIDLFLNSQNWELIQVGMSNSENWFNRQFPFLGIYSNLNSQCGQTNRGLCKSLNYVLYIS